MEWVKSFYDFIVTHKGELLEQTLEHLTLTLISLFIATALGLS